MSKYSAVFSKALIQGIQACSQRMVRKEMPVQCS